MKQAGAFTFQGLMQHPNPRYFQLHNIPGLWVFSCTKLNQGALGRPPAHRCAYSFVSLTNHRVAKQEQQRWDFCIRRITRSRHQESLRFCNESISSSEMRRQTWTPRMEISCFPVTVLRWWYMYGQGNLKNFVQKLLWCAIFVHYEFRMNSQSPRSDTPAPNLLALTRPQGHEMNFHKKLNKL
jgi:hypothetical protein